MRQFKNLLVRVLLAVFVLFMAFPNTMMVQAEEVEAELITLEETEDFTVMFTYEGDRPVITFLSPSGVEYAEGVSPETVFASAHGDGWSTYKVIGAEAGTWRVRCDKKNNEYVDYSFVEEIDGLCIQNFNVVSMEGEDAVLSFLVTMGEDERTWYSYTITAIAGEDESAGKQLKSGSALTGETEEVKVKLELSSYDNYRFLLNVVAQDGLEMFDSMMSEPFSYVNAETPEAMENFYATIDMSNHSVELDWDEYRMGWGKEYTVLAIANGDTDNPIYMNEPKDNQDSFFYPVGTEQLTIQLFYKDDGVLSEPVTKEIDLVNGEKLQVVTEEVTSGTQLELAYKTMAPSLLEVWLNEEYGQSNIEGENTVYYPLSAGVNTIQASFVGDNNITYRVRAEIFRDATPPVLTLYENLDGMTFKDAEAVISGAVKNAAKLTINDVEVSVDENGVFEYCLPLTEGVNNITIVATSASGIGTSRNMQITKAGGVLAVGSWKDYLPLLIALGVSVVLILYTLIFVRKKDKVSGKPKRAMTYKRFALKLGFWTLVLDAFSVAGYIYFYRFNNSRQYMELVKESVSKAARYIDYQQYCFDALLILSGVLVLNLVIGLVVSTIRKKKVEKAEKSQTETQNAVSDLKK